MAIPIFLASSFSYLQMIGVTDVADVIVAFRDEVLNQQTPAWTEPVAGTFKSPPDANGRFFEVDLVATTSVRLGITVRDDTGFELMEREAQLGGGTSSEDNCRIYTGQFHMRIEFEDHGGGALGETIGAGITDLSPEPSDIIRHNTWANGRRSSAGTADASGDTLGDFFMLDNGLAAVDRRPLGILTTANTVAPLFTHSGSIITRPVVMTSVAPGNPLGADQPIGRLHQCLQVDDNFAAGAELTVPIDDALTGVFKVTVAAFDNSYKIAWRKA